MTKFVLTPTVWLAVISCSAGGTLPWSWVCLIFCSPVSAITMKWKQHCCKDKNSDSYSGSDRASLWRAGNFSVLLFPNKSDVRCAAKPSLLITLPQEGKVLSAETPFDLVFFDWVPQAAWKTVCSWSALVNKERQERREGWGRVNHLSATFVFMEIRSAELALMWKQTHTKWKAASEISAAHLKFVVFMTLLSLPSPLLFKIWGQKAKEQSHIRTVLCADSSAKLCCSPTQHLPSVIICNFSS